VSKPPILDGNPISIVNLHRQLTSPIDVLASAIGDTPLAMKIIFNGQDEGIVQFDVGAPTTEDLREGDSSTKIPSIQIRNSRGITRDSLDESYDGLSTEEARMLVGMQQRREARASRDQSLERRSMTPDAEGSSLRQSFGPGDFIPVHIDYE
jgi:hypothetical protein